MPLRIESNLSDELEELISKVIGCAIEVHRHLGPGYIESIYDRALCHELHGNGLSFERQKDIFVPYKDIVIPGQRLDLIVEKQLVIELKAIDSISTVHEAQLLSYLKSTGLRAGLIINFKVQQLKFGIKRMVL